MEAENVKLSSSTRLGWHVASLEALRSGSLSIEPVHLFYAILTMVDGVLDPPHQAALLAALDEEPTLAEDVRSLMAVLDRRDLTRIRRAVQRSLPRTVDLVIDDGRALRRSPRCREVFELAAMRAVRDGTAVVSLLHVFGALVEDPPGDIAPFLPACGPEKPVLLWESRLNAFADQPHVGRIVLVMTVVEGSMSMRRRFGDLESARILRLHDNLIRQELGASRGSEIQVVGEAFLIAFPDETEAVEFALRVQAGLRAHEDLAAIPVRVRIGIHAAPLLTPAPPGARSNPLLETAVDTTTRLASLAAGDQVLVDKIVFEQAIVRRRETVPDGLREIDSCDHGEYPVNGSAAPIRIFEVGHRGKVAFVRPGDARVAIRGPD
jgi:class 3 adenylate cyclase